MTGHDQPPIAAPSPSSLPPSLPTPPAGDYYLEMDQGRGLREYGHILLRRKWWVIGAFLTIFLAAALYTLTRTPIFRAAATFQITQDNPGSRVSGDDKMSQLLGYDTLAKFQETQHKILGSRSLALRVITALSLQEHPDFKPNRKENPGKSETDIEDNMIDIFLGKLEITPVRNSFLVEVSFQSPDKSLAQKVVNAIANEYMYLSIDRRNESFILVRKWLDNQLQDMAVKVQEAQKKLYKFGQKTDIYTLEDKDNVIVQKFIDLSGLLTKAQAEKMGKEAQFRQVKEKGPNAPLIVNHPLVASLRQQLTTQKAKVSALQKVFRSGHPELQAEQANSAAMQSRLQAEIQRLQESVKADYEAAQRTEKLLQEGLATQKEQMIKLQDNLTDYQILKRDAQTNEQLYQALLARVKEANIAGTMVATNVAVIDPAPLPSQPFKPKTMRNLALATVLGLILAVALALLIENLDDTIKSPDDLERGCNLPSLGTLPLLSSNNRIALSRRRDADSLARWRSLPWLKRRSMSSAQAADVELIVYKHPQDPLTEALRHIETSIMLSAAGQPPSAIMITSPNPSEGKTALATNLALSLALHGRPTVIIDCDLRKPRVHQIFELDVQPGFTNYLTGNATLEEVLRATAIPNLRVISTGARSPNPANLLNSEIFKDLLTQLRQQFLHLIIDTPPILGFADARIISALVDGVLLVTKHHVTHKSAAKLAHQLLSQIHAPIMGAVLNCFDTSGQGYGGYHYQYKYYSKYYDVSD